MPEKEKPIGFDLVNVEPRFGEETKEEFFERFQQRYFEVYGEYPETPSTLIPNNKEPQKKKLQQQP